MKPPLNGQPEPAPGHGPFLSTRLRTHPCKRVTGRGLFGKVEDGRGSSGPLAIAPFPIPVHQTGRADFRHPAFRLASPRGTRRGSSVQALKAQERRVLDENHIESEAHLLRNRFYVADLPAGMVRATPNSPAFPSSGAAFEPVSASRGLCCRETVILQPDQGAEMAVGIQLAARRDQAPARKPAGSGLFAKSREISVRVRLRGGPGRSVRIQPHQCLTAR